MATLAERIAAKKAAEAAAKGVSNEATEKKEESSPAPGNQNVSRVENASGSADSDAQKPQVQDTQKGTSGTISAGVASKQMRKPTQEEAEAKAKELVPTTDASGKPLSGFAVTVARKKKVQELLANWMIEEEANGTESTEQPGLSDNGAENQAAEREASTDESQGKAGTLHDVQESTEDAIEESQSSAENVEEVDEESEEYKAATPEARQAYSDIKQRITNLHTMMGEDIKTEMAELKKSLMKNPSAVALMLPSDIGQMVIALRKMTGVELEKQKETKSSNGKAKKVKEVALTAEQLEDAWKEL